MIEHALYIIKDPALKDELRALAVDGNDKGGQGFHSLVMATLLCPSKMLERFNSPNTHDEYVESFIKCISC